ncbi:MAG TPA: M48 family metalloprotease [Steroidobacteraceae bacterium]|nr:M48 family metalloprotease [Steroidobacteraceae bacterium]
MFQGWNRIFPLTLGLCASLVALGAASPLQQANAAKMSLVVVDQQCATIVEPFKISDNLGKLAKDAIGGMLGGLKDRVVNHGSTPDAKEIPEKTRLQAKRMNWLPMNVETMYGQRLHDKETLILDREKAEGKKYYPIADKILEDAKRGINAPHDYTFKLFILKQPGRNALARPGGFLYLDVGLLKDRKQLDKAYFAVAHEISHVLKRHETRELQGLIIDSFETAEDLKSIVNAGSHPDAVLAKVKIDKDQYIRHHMDQELQADACAARILGESYADNAKLAASIRAFLKELVPPTKEELEQETNAAKLQADQRALVADAEAKQARKKSKKKNRDEKTEDGLDATVLAYDIVTTPANRHPNSRERTSNLDAMYAELTAQKPKL